MGKQKDLGFGKDLQGVPLAQDVLGFLRVQLVQWALEDQGALGDLGSPLVLVHPAVVKQELSAGRANPSHHHPKSPRQASLTEAEEIEASPRLLPGKVSKSDGEPC